MYHRGKRSWCVMVTTLEGIFNQIWYENETAFLSYVVSFDTDFDTDSNSV